MTLFTDDELRRLRCNGQPDRHGRDWNPVVRLVLPGSACVWILTEILPGHNERFAYGLAHYGYTAVHEGYIDLFALYVMTDPLSDGRYCVQRDPNFAPKHTVSVYRLAAMMYGYLTDDPEHLEDAAQYLRERAEHDVTQAIRSGLSPAAPEPQ